jgi:glycosyltransferase involved in cell wall biosynthesis
MLDESQPLDRLRSVSDEDVLIYHASFGDPHVTRALLRWRGRLVLIYHNITPSEYFLDINPAFAAGLQWGRHELSLLVDRTVLNVADSHFNAADLHHLGFPDVHVVPAGLQPGRLLDALDDRATLELLGDHVDGPFVLNVSQLLPHKRQDVLIQAVHLAQWCDGLDVGLVLVGPSPSLIYERALHELARRLRIRNMWFAGQLSERGLASVYRRAAVFASASEHEGLGIPPLEAMAFGVPAVVRNAGATRETVDRAALVLPHDAGPLLYSAAIARMLQDESVRSAFVERGRQRCYDVRLVDRCEELVSLIDDRALIA